MTDVPLKLPKKFKNKIIKLEAEISILIPSTQGIHEQQQISMDEMEKRVKDVRAYFAGLFGGYTSVSAKGGYTLKSGCVIAEDIVMVTAFADMKQALHLKEDLLCRLSRWATEWGQETVGLEWEGDMFLVPGTLMK